MISHDRYELSRACTERGNRQDSAQVVGEEDNADHAGPRSSETDETGAGKRDRPVGPPCWRTPAREVWAAREEMLSGPKTGFRGPVKYPPLFFFFLCFYFSYFVLF